MTRNTLAALITLAPTAALAHDAGGVPHIHPHGGELAMAALACAVAFLAWRILKS